MNDRQLTGNGRLLCAFSGLIQISYTVFYTAVHIFLSDDRFAMPPRAVCCRYLTNDEAEEDEYIFDKTNLFTIYYEKTDLCRAPDPHRGSGGSGSFGS